jgi:chloramphenicol O-acetyltransferase type A
MPFSINGFSATRKTPRKNYIELPDGYLYFNLNVNWGKPFEKDRKGLLPSTIRLNHAIADGYPISKFFLFFEEGLQGFIA